MRVITIREFDDEDTHGRAQDARDEFTAMPDLVGAVGDAVACATPKARRALRQTMRAWAEDCGDEYAWAFGPSAPALLHRLLIAIDLACDAGCEDSAAAKAA
jgi:hypothetical protein